MANCDSASPIQRRPAALAFSLALSLALGGAAPACGDDLEPRQDTGGEADEDDDDGGSACASTEVDEFPDGLLARPEELTVEGFDCPDGGLAGVDLGGRWSVGLSKPMIRQSCEDGVEVEIEQGDDPLVHLDDTNLFVRVGFEGETFAVASAFRACAGPGSDELAVVEASCFQEADAEEPDCRIDAGTMRRSGRLPGEVEADGLELVAEWAGGDAPWPPGTPTNVKVVDGVAYVSRLIYGLDEVADMRIVDVSDPENPRDLGVLASSEQGPGDFNDVKLFQVDGRTHAVLAGAVSPVVDASDPANPVVVSQLEYSHSVFLREDADGRPLAYLATSGGTADMPIYDLSDPANPVLLERVVLPPGEMSPDGMGSLHDLYAEEDRLYLNAQGDGFTIMDRQGEGWVVREPRLPQSGFSHASWVGEIEGRPIAITGDEGFDAHMQVVDVDPASDQFMTELGKYQTRPDVSIHNMMLFGSRVYFTYYQDGVRILDLADPTDPQLVAYYNTWDEETGSPGSFAGAVGLDVDVDAGLIYVADMDRGLLILRETR